MAGMGIAYKDLKAGRYYKGTLDNGSKVFMFVESVVAVAGGAQVGVTGCEFERKTGAGAWVNTTGRYAASDDSRMRREVTRAEVQGEGVPQAPLDSPKHLTAPAPKVGTTTSGTKVASSPSTPPPLRRDGSPKNPIPDNARSPTCLHCRKPTRTLTLLQFSAQWCSDCEP
jgi:hypothetical protein